ncbi:hypothetical protein DXG03_001244 [Asterophora parasitica]|uniref:Uncharacterized protein n=1 Tax=Asterophora parasitica TaxID=117018 RepID=A0A9P7G3B4_9AGAR|nr:hypothetical protein DXG03_001244 [Asterophora parasitica]
MPSAPPSLPPIPISPLTAGLKTIEAEDLRCQRSLRSSPAFSSSPFSRAMDQGTSKAIWSASPSEWEDPATANTSKKGHESPSLQTPSAPEECTLDPPSASPFLFPPPHSEPGPFKPTFCTSAPRTRGAGKGHNRAALTNMTNITHINLPSCVSASLPSPMTAPLVDIPVQRPHSFSITRKLTSEGLHSPSKAHSSPLTHPDSRTAPQDLLKTVSPLRIVKRSQGSLSPDPRNSTTSNKSAVASDVISAVRDAFARTRPECPEDEGEKARELISRESVLTCDEVPSAWSKYNTNMSVVYEDDESDEGYSQDTPSTGTPPPPYMDWYPAFLGSFKPTALARLSAELSYLKALPVASADSGLDDILASFEALIASMPKFASSLAKDGESVVFGEKTASRSVQYCPGDTSSERVPQWSDVLHLDSY